MTVIRPNSISGVSSITGSGGDISIFRADGTAADVTVNNITGVAATFTGAINTASATITGNLGVGGTLTYEDVTNIDSVGVITARSGIDAASNLLLKTGGTERVRITSTGNVGLGTITPVGASGKTLDISGGSGQARIAFHNDTTGYASGDGSQIFSDGNTLGLQARESAGIIQFETAGGERLRIGSAGQLGIGGANYGTSGQFLQSQGASSAVQWASVSSDLQFAQWRVNTPFGGGDVDPITNWTETSDKNVTLTESSGIFSFPSTGYWEIMMQMYGYKNNDQDNIELHIMRTVNNSNYHTKSWAYSHMNNDDGGNLYVSIRASLVFDVTDTANCKIKFKTINNNVNWAASSSVNNSYAIFKRLAAT